MRINKREFNWSLQRMARIIAVWKKLNNEADRILLLSKFRDEYPKEFWEVVNERRMYQPSFRGSH